MIKNHLGETLELTWQDKPEEAFKNVILPADIRRLTAEEMVAFKQELAESVTYRAIFAYDRPPLPPTTVAFWRGQEYTLIGPSMLATRHGQIHHHEAIMSREVVTGTPPP